MKLRPILPESRFLNYSDTHNKESGINEPPTFSDNVFRVACNSDILSSMTFRLGDQSAGQAVLIILVRISFRAAVRPP